MAAKAEAASVNSNVELLLNQLRAYQRSSSQRHSPQPAHPLQQLTQQPAQQQQQQQQQRNDLQLVSAAWLEAVLSTGRHVPESPYSLNTLLQQQQPRSRLQTAAAAPAGPLDDEEGAAAAAGGGSGAGSSAVLLSRLPDLSNLPDAPLGR
jgi:hypothetical protein